MDWRPPSRSSPREAPLKVPRAVRPPLLTYEGPLEAVKSRLYQGPGKQPKTNTRSIGKRDPVWLYTLVSVKATAPRGPAFIEPVPESVESPTGSSV